MKWKRVKANEDKNVVYRWFEKDRGRTIASVVDSSRFTDAYEVRISNFKGERKIIPISKSIAREKTDKDFLKLIDKYKFV
jgi:hypothetical protein